MWIAPPAVNHRNVAASFVHNFCLFLYLGYTDFQTFKLNNVFMLLYIMTVCIQMIGILFVLCLLRVFVCIFLFTITSIACTDFHVATDVLLIFGSIVSFE